MGLHRRYDEEGTRFHLGAPGASDMSSIEPMFEVAGIWGLPRDTAVTMVEADCVAAVHWRRALPAFEEAVLPQHALVYLVRLGTKLPPLRRHETAASAAGGDMGLLPAGSYGAWSFQTPVEVLHMYISQPRCSSCG
jgi:hypothetical protein